jgi:hypothetical protein
MSEQAPEFGEFQTAEWLEAEGRWVVRDMTPEELLVAFPPPPDPTPEEALANARKLATLTRPELAFQMGQLGFLVDRDDRLAFARGEVPGTLETLIATLATANALDEETEERLLLGMAGWTEFPRVDAFWEMAVAAEIVTEEQLDQAFGVDAP